ncbi:MAG TPA: two-component sensor histidine kinase, partial [Arenibaculum sp.]|nr:two-component sensor histidine kinase [Arenibaculum sp.]
MKRGTGPAFPPMGIAARIALTIVLALLLTQAVSAVLYVTDRSRGGPPTRPLMLVSRVAAIVSVAEATAPAQRARVLRAVDAPGLEVELRRGPPRGVRERGGVPYDVLRGQFRDVLGDPERP